MDSVEKWISHFAVHDVEGRGERYTSHPSQKREGWGTRGFVVSGVWKVRVSGLHPTLRRSAKDGAPGFLWLVECGRAWWAGGLHPTVRRSAKDGAPGLLWLVDGGR